MSAPQKTPAGKDYFGSFLDTVQSAQPEAPAEAPAEPPVAEASVAEEGAAASLADIIGLLHREGDLPITEIAGRLKSPTIETTQVVARIHSAGLVTVAGQPGREVVHLTEAGASLAGMK